MKIRIDMTIPNEGCLYDYFYVFKQKGSWKLWTDVVRRHEPEVNQYGVHVATIDSARYTYLVNMHIKVCKKIYFFRNYRINNNIFPNSCI